MPRGSGSRLPAEVVFEDFESCRLVDDAFLFFGIFTGFAEFFRGGHGGEAFVNESKREAPEVFLELLAEEADFLGAGSLGSVHAEREAENDGLDLPLGDDFENSRDGLGLADVDGFDGVGRDGELIGGGDPDAGVAVVDG